MPSLVTLKQYYGSENLSTSINNIQSYRVSFIARSSKILANQTDSGYIIKINRYYALLYMDFSKI